jgi:hypothetical protein
MRFYTNQHRYYCGIDLHARSMYVRVLDSQGEILLHKNMTCNADRGVRPAPYPSPQSNWTTLGVEPYF